MSYADTLPPPQPQRPDEYDPLWPYSWICRHMPRHGDSIDDWIAYYRWACEAYAAVGAHHAIDSDSKRIKQLERMRAEGVTTYP